MRRGQRAAQDAKCGPWKLAGVRADKGETDAVYERVVQRMRADGLWEMVTESRRVDIAHTIMLHGTGAEMDLFRGLERGMAELTHALKLLALSKLGDTLKD